MFHPSANRLAAFLEISALSISLAQSGAQYKAGFLRIDAVTNKGPFGKRGTTWTEKKKQKWCSVRESYLVVVEEMGEVGLVYLPSAKAPLTMYLRLAGRTRRLHD